MAEISDIWEVELQILDKIDDFCRKNGLKYSLAFGTLIGAIRHKGFIPWDDDVDIMMPREDYDFLINNWDISGFVLQNKTTDCDFSQNFTKIRKDHTTFIQGEFEKNVSYHTGIFVDVFPGDRVAPKGVGREIQFIQCAVNLLYSREFCSKEGSLVLEKILLGLPRKWRLAIRNRCDKNIQKWNHTNNDFFFPSTMKEAKVYYPSNMFEEMIELQFEDRKYMCTKDYDEVLRRFYGDYMTMPPISERVLKHHPIVVDLERNFNEISL